MYCGNCGKKIKKGIKFCPECGTSIVIQTDSDISIDAEGNTPKKYWTIPKVIFGVIMGLLLPIVVTLIYAVVSWLISIPSYSTFNGEYKYVSQVNKYNSNYYIIEFFDDGTASMNINGNIITGNYSYDAFKNIYNLEIDPNIYTVNTNFSIKKEYYDDKGKFEEHILVTGGVFLKTKFIKE